MIYAFANRQGVISFSSTGPYKAGMFVLGWGKGKAFKDAVSVVARHAYDGKTLLVPGIPEADDDLEAYSAAQDFGRQLQKRGFTSSAPTEPENLTVTRRGRCMSQEEAAMLDGIEAAALDNLEAPPMHPGLADAAGKLKAAMLAVVAVVALSAPAYAAPPVVLGDTPAKTEKAPQPAPEAEADALYPPGCKPPERIPNIYDDGEAAVMAFRKSPEGKCYFQAKRNAMTRMLAPKPPAPTK